MVRVQSVRLWIALGAAAALLLVALFVVLALLPKPADRLPGPNGYQFWAGINYPWKSYQDFGTGAWGHSGVSNPGVYDEIDTDFANMAALGIQVVKWRVFSDGRYSPEFADDGTVLGYDDMFLKDIDAALQIAAKHNLYLEFSLFDKGLWTQSCQVNGVQFGGHGDLMTDPAKRKSLIEKAILPLVDHVASSGRVIGWELIAEPEWGITELNTDQDGRSKLPLAGVQAFVKDAADAIHRHGGRLVTVEANRPSNMKYWKGLGLDYYTFSWYDWMEPYEPLDVPAKSYGLDKPIVLGEYPISNSAYYDPPMEMEIAYGQGYAGGFAWSYQGADKYGSLRDVHDSYARWLLGHWQTTDLSGGRVRPPSSGVALLPPPFSEQGVKVQKDGQGTTVDVGLSVREGGNFHVQFYFYPYNSNPGQPVADRSLALQSGAQGTLHLTLPAVAEGQDYRLSMAIFDDQWTIRKWFDSMTVFSVQNGQVAYPTLSDLDKENPCAKSS